MFCRYDNSVNDKERYIKRVEIHYIDYGNKEWVQKKHVYPLPQKFAQAAPQVSWIDLYLSVSVNKKYQVTSVYVLDLLSLSCRDF